jgi:hypothetical protein
MVTDDATCRGAEHTMVAGKMTGSAAHQGTLDTPFSISRGCDREKRHRSQCARKGPGHFFLPRAIDEVVSQHRPPSKSSTSTKAGAHVGHQSG